MTYTTYMTPPSPTHDREVRVVEVLPEPSSRRAFSIREVVAVRVYRLAFKAVKWTGPEWLRCNCHTGRHVWYEWSFEGYV